MFSLTWVFRITPSSAAEVLLRRLWENKSHDGAFQPCVTVMVNSLL